MLAEPRGAVANWSKSTPSGRSRYCRWRMRAGYVLLPLSFVLARPTKGSLIAALFLAVPGLALRLWASGHLEKARRLATGGPYAHTRHPLYLANSLLALAFGVASARAWALLLIAAYISAFYPPIMREEDSFLRSTFPAEFEGWAGKVPVSCRACGRVARAAAPSAGRGCWPITSGRRGWAGRRPSRSSR